MSPETENFNRKFFSILQGNFDRSFKQGRVQFLTTAPAPGFVLTVEKTGLSYSDGTAPDATSTITVSEALLSALCTSAPARQQFDRRVVEFSKGLTLTGDTSLGSLILDLVKEPSAATVALLDTARRKAQGKSTQEVQSIDRPERNWVVERVREFQPFLATGMLGDWNVAAWSPEALRTRVGNRARLASVAGTIHDFAATMTSPPAIEAPGAGPQAAYGIGEGRTYTDGLGLPGVLWPQFPQPAVLREAGFTGFPQLWMGSSWDGTPVTPLHMDCVHGVLCQVFGRKKVLLYAADQEDWVYPFRAFNMHRPCWANPVRPDYETFPLFKRATPVELTLSPGDVLYIPAGWFHLVLALDPVMSISYPSAVA